MTSTDFHVEAIYRLCFVCGSIIMKNGHHILPVMKEPMSQNFESSINLLENATSTNMCHSCWRTVKQFLSHRRPHWYGCHILTPIVVPAIYIF